MGKMMPSKAKYLDFIQSPSTVENSPCSFRVFFAMESMSEEVEIFLRNEKVDVPWDGTSRMPLEVIHKKTSHY